MFFVLIIIMATINGFDSVHNFANIPCGKRNIRIGKIVGGETAEEGEFPWLVSLTRRGGHFCGGSLLTTKHVLTAGHCLCSGSSLLPPQQIKITLAQHDLTVSSPTKQEMSVKSFMVHPDYKCRNPKSDLALILMENEIEWSEFVGPACLPTGIDEGDYERFVDALATVAGWGWTNEDTQLGGRANTLQKASVNILETERCQKWFQSQGKKTKLQDGQMCAGYEKGGVDSCWADSGGPLMVISNTKQMMVVGVVSTGIGCARPFLPGIYTRVSDYIPWIKSIVGNSS